MTRRAHRSAHGHPLPDGPAPFTTLVQLTFEKRKIEHWIRFGRKSYEQIIDRRRSVVGFAPESRSRHCPSCAPAATSSCGSTAGRRCSAPLP